MSKFLSLGWFKESVENSIDRVISRKLEKMMDEEDVATDKVATPSPVKLYKTLNIVNDVITVVTLEGNIITKPGATLDDYIAIRDAKNLDGIYSILGSPQIVAEKKAIAKEEKKISALQKGIKSLGKLDDFKVKDNTVYFKGTERSIPQLLVEKFLEVVNLVAEENDGQLPLQEALNQDEEYLSLKNFFMWCCLNPRAEVANELYDFLSRNGFKITKQGFFVALRNVVTLAPEGDQEMVNFISNAYNKVKAVWKKNPSNFYLSKDAAGNTTLTSVKPTSGDDRTLTELYLELPNMAENRYTDNWSRTFDIRIGKLVSMPSEACDWSTQDCATAGLHFAGYTAPYVLCGDTTVFTLINPMKVVGIGTEKGRCYEYLPFMLTSVAEADKIMNDDDFDFLQLDEEYAIKELESLAERAKEGFAIEAKKYQFNMPQMSSKELNKIVLSLSQMKEYISTRVSTLE